MSGKLYIGLDIGTSSVKGVLLTETERVLKTVRVPFEYITGTSGKVEIEAEKYFCYCCSALKQLACCVPEDCRVEAVCAGSASGNLLLLDENHIPLTPVINWQDRRTGTETADVLGSDFDRDEYYRSTGWAFDGKTFPLASLCRLKLREPELFDKCAFVCMSTEYLIWRLTGNWGISTSAGTPFYLIDQVSGKYRTDVLNKLGITLNMLPPVVGTGSVLGTVLPEAAVLTELSPETKLIAGAFDHPSAARGTGVVHRGELLLSCGTSWVGLWPVKDRELLIKNGMLTDPFLSENGGPWAGMVSLASVASEIERYIRNFVSDGENAYADFERLSSQSQTGAGGLKIYFDDNDDPEYIRSFPARHVARAVMESVVSRLDEKLKRIAEGGIEAEKAVMVGGPTGCPTWARVIEEITGIKTEIRHGAFAGAIGSAFIAMNKKFY